MRVEQISPANHWKKFADYKFIVNGSMLCHIRSSPINVLFTGKLIFKTKGT